MLSIIKQKKSGQQEYNLLDMTTQKVPANQSTKTNLKN